MIFQKNLKIWIFQKIIKIWFFSKKFWKYDAFLIEYSMRKCDLSSNVLILLLVPRLVILRKNIFCASALLCFSRIMLIHRISGNARVSSRTRSFSYWNIQSLFSDKIQLFLNILFSKNILELRFFSEFFSGTSETLIYRTSKFGGKICVRLYFRIQE